MKNRMIFRCNTCGEYVSESVDGESFLECCGRSRMKLALQTGDASPESHMPVLDQEAGKLVVRVGRTEHPMVAGHHLDWIGLEIDGLLLSVTLHPGDDPRAVFDPAAFIEDVGQAAQEKGKAPFPVGHKVRMYAHCSLHGLWKAEG